MTAAIEPRADLPALTGIRGIAAWLVVLYHIRTAAGGQLPDWLMSVLNKGYLAVDLFFMLSGFVLWLNYAERLRAGGIGAAPQFLVRRIARILPLHLFVLAGAILYAAVLAAAGRHGPEQYPWGELPLHILLVQNWGFTDRLTWNDPSWSISCEFAAYLLFPLLALRVDWRRLPAIALLALVAALSLGLAAVMSAGGATVMDNYIPRLGIFRALFQFTIGTILCALWFRWASSPARPLLGAVVALSVLGGLGIAGVLPEILVVPPLFASLLMIVALTGGKAANPLAWRSVHYLGEISYSTYLLHFLLFVVFKYLFVEDPENVPLPLLGAFLLLTLIGSVLLHHGLERPAQRLLNRAYDALPLSRPRGLAG